MTKPSSPTDLLTRAFGILTFAGGTDIRASVVDDDRTDIFMLEKVVLGSIVKDASTGRWSYDRVLRDALGIEENPFFDTDKEAGDALSKYLPSDERNERARPGAARPGAPLMAPPALKIRPKPERVCAVGVRITPGVTA